MRQFADLEIQKNEGMREPVVEHQVDKEMLAVERDPLLTAHEGETFAEFEQEVLELGDQCLFQVGIVERSSWLSPVNSSTMGSFTRSEGCVISCPF